MRLFILDVPIIALLGFIIARVHARFLVDRHPDFYFHVGVIVVLIFWINALLAALGLIDPWGTLAVTRPTSRWIALFYVLSYPLWFIWGGKRAFMLFGRNPRQGGFLWPLRAEDRTQPFRPPWTPRADESQVNKDG